MSDIIPNYIDYSAENYSEANRKLWAEHPYGTVPIKYGYFSNRTFSDYEAYLPHRRPRRPAAAAQPHASNNERTPLLGGQRTQSLETIERSRLAPREKTAKIAEFLQQEADDATQAANAAWQRLWEARHRPQAAGASLLAPAAAAAAPSDDDEVQRVEIPNEDPTLADWKQLEKNAIRARFAAKDAIYIATEVASTAKWYRTATGADQVRLATERKIQQEHSNDPLYQVGPNGPALKEENLNNVVARKEEALAHITGNIFTHDNPYARYGFSNLNWNEGDFVINLDLMLDEKWQTPTGAADPRLTENPSYTFGLVGCHGVDGIVWGEDGLFSGYALPPTSHTALKKIGTQLSDRTKYLFNFLLGDNFYHFGTTDPRSKQFTTCFHRFFKNVPAYAILGNHDYNMHGQAKGPLGIFKAPHPRMRKIYRAMCQVYHSYIANWDHDTLINEFPHQWNMPFRYYSLVSLKTNTVFICIDSNTLPFDTVQQEWLCKTYHRLKQATNGAARNMILVSHHPLEYYGERAIKPNEWKKYVQDDLRSQRFPQEPKLYRYTHAANGDGSINITDTIQIENPVFGAQELNQNKTIGHYLKYFLEQNNLVFSVIFAAHEHLLAYEKIHMHYTSTHVTNHTIHQFVSGAGGADLEALTDVALQTAKRNYNRGAEPALRVYHKEGIGQARVKYGYMSATLDRNTLQVTVYKIEPDEALETITMRFDQIGNVRFSAGAGTIALTPPLAPPLLNAAAAAAPAMATGGTDALLGTSAPRRELGTELTVDSQA